MKLGLWVTLVLVGQTFINTSAHASVACSNLFVDKEISQLRALEAKALKEPAKKSATKSKKDLNSIVEGIATFIEKTGRVPSEKEIANELKLTTEEVSAIFAKKNTPDIYAMVAIAKQTYPEVFKMYEARLASKAVEYLEENNALPSIKEMAEALNISQKEVVAIYGGNKDILARISEYERKSLEKITDSLLKLYVKAARVYGRSPTLEEMAEGSKFSVEALKSLIGKGRLINELGDLHKMAEVKNPKSLKGVVNLELYNDQKFSDLMRDLKEGERLVITTGIAGAEVNKDFLAALKTYHKTNKAPLFIKPVNNETGGLDATLHNEKFVHILISEIELGSELKLSNIPITAKQINPLMGLNRIGKRGQSMIVGSPKAHVDVVATKDNQFRPHILMSTGSINNPNVYQGAQYISKRTDYMAEQDHFMGAIVIEKTSAQDDLVSGPSTGTFHYRHIEYIPEKRGFMDLNKFYTAEGVKEVRAEAVAFGDTHVAQTDHKLTLATRIQILQKLKPYLGFVHDIFDGQSISHYERDKAITLAIKAERGQLNLREEMDVTVDYVRALADAAPADSKIVVDAANHNNWVNRYVESGQFMKEPINTELGLELARVMTSGKNPIEYYFEKSLGTQYMRRIIFISEKESLSVGPDHRKVLMSEHGDRGANGAKGSLGAFQRGADRSAYGHTHTVQRRNGTANFGTMSKNPMPYSEGGFSNWVQGVLVVGPNGEQQILMYKNGEWYRDTSRPLPKSEEFFEEGYPYAKPNNAPTNAVQVDQYTTKHK